MKSLYSKAEQTARLKDFERWVRQARRSWQRGEAVVVLSYGEYLKLLTQRGRKSQ